MKQKGNSRSADRLKILRMMSLYSVVMLIILTSVILLARRAPTDAQHTQPTSSTAQTEYVYVRPESSSNTTDNAPASELEEIYTVREYMDKIGIFTSDGSLVRVLDVYTKTLPEADRRLLREGIEIIGKKQLNAIIEDYTG